MARLGYKLFRHSRSIPALHGDLYMTGTDVSGDILMTHGGYEKLRSYKVAEAVYDATVVFCNRFISRQSRTHDQMVQAARSGVRNISEGSGAAATSRKSEMLLTNVARASLSDELIKDYKSFLIQNGLRVWSKDSPEAKDIRERLRYDTAQGPHTEHMHIRGLSDLSNYVSKAEPEQAANAMLCAVNQAAYLLRRQIEAQGRIFVEEGGFSERLHASRMKRREMGKSDKSDGSDQSDKSDNPTCPLCGKGMLRRMAQQGPHEGQPFWGCAGYPHCKGILPVGDAK